MLKKFYNKDTLIKNNKITYTIGLVLTIIMVLISLKTSLIVFLFPVLFIIGIFIKKPIIFIYAITLIFEFTIMQNYINLYIKILTLLFFLYALFLYKKEFKINFFYKLFLVFIIYNLLTYVISWNYPYIFNSVSQYGTSKFINLSVANLLSYVCAWFLSILTYNFINNKNRIVTILNLFIYVGNIVSVLSIILYFLFSKGLILNLPDLLFRNVYGIPAVLGNRLIGTAYEPLAFGNQTAILIPITLGLFFYNKEIRYLIFTIIELITLIFTFSTGAWICFTISIFIMFLLINIKLGKMSKMKNVVIIIFVCLLIVMIGIFIMYFTKLGTVVMSTLIDKLFGTMSDSYSLSERRGMNKALINIFINYPIFGVGVGRFVYYIEKFAPMSQFMYINLPIPPDWKANNDYLTILAETGIIGMGIFAALIINIINNVRSFINDNKDYKFIIIYIGIFCSILIVLLQMFFGFFIYNYYLWILVGILFSISDNKIKEQ